MSQITNLQSALKTANEAKKLVDEQELTAWHHVDYGNAYLKSIVADLDVVLKASQGSLAPVWLQRISEIKEIAEGLEIRLPMDEPRKHQLLSKLDLIIKGIQASIIDKTPIKQESDDEGNGKARVDVDLTFDGESDDDGNEDDGNKKLQADTVGRQKPHTETTAITGSVSVNTSNNKQSSNIHYAGATGNVGHGIVDYGSNSSWSTTTKPPCHGYTYGLPNGYQNQHFAKHPQYTSVPSHFYSSQNSAVPRRRMSSKIPTLPPSRLVGDRSVHLEVFAPDGKQKTCRYCSYQRAIDKQNREEEPHTVSHVTRKCSACDTYLCKQHFAVYHGWSKKNSST